jgi:hypothetical protein
MPLDDALVGGLHEQLQVGASEQKLNARGGLATAELVHVRRRSRAAQGQGAGRIFSRTTSLSWFCVSVRWSGATSFT